MDKNQILYLLHELNSELEKNEVTGEIIVVGGVTMCLQFNARQSTEDINALFQSTTIIREVIIKIADREGITTDWLNDGVKGFLNQELEYDSFYDYLI